MLGYRAKLPAVNERAAAAGITPSTAELAACTGIPRRTVSRIRAGDAVSRRTADAFAAELGATREHLFDAVQVR